MSLLFNNCARLRKMAESRGIGYWKIFPQVVDFCIPRPLHSIQSLYSYLSASCRISHLVAKSIASPDHNGEIVNLLPHPPMPNLLLIL